MSDASAETCAECGFDSRHWAVRDAQSWLMFVGSWWQQATADVTIDVLNRRPSAGVWSVLEYGLHSAVAIAELREVVAAVLATDGVAVPPGRKLPSASTTEDPLQLDRAAVLADLGREAAAMADLASDASAPWSNVGRRRGPMASAELWLLHALHDATHHQMDAARGLSALGAGTPPHTGSVAQLNVSRGGVPKTPIEHAVVGFRGIEGDAQKVRKHHGRPFQALCLWSDEVIAALAAEGHPVARGSAGENVTLAGVDWAAMRPGTRLRIGTVLAEVSADATPCKQQARWFTDGDFNRVSIERAPDRVRWYAWVREPGEIHPADEVVVQPST